MLVRDERPDDAFAVTYIHYAAISGQPTHTPGIGPVGPHIVDRLRRRAALCEVRHDAW
jgi:hypothetical protein